MGHTFQRVRQTDRDWICHLLGEFSLHTADVLLLHLSISDLVLHLSRLLRAPAEEQQPGRQSIQPMNRPQVLQVVLLSQDKDHRVVPITSTWVHLVAREGEEDTLEIKVVLQKGLNSI